MLTTKIWNYNELDPWHIIHILGFITPNYFPICLMIVVTLAIFQVWDWVGVYLGRSVTGRCSTCSQYPLASELFSSSIRKSSLSYSSQCGIILLCQVLQKVTFVLFAVFIRQYSSVIRNITSVPSIILQPHCCTACRQRAVPPVSKHIFAGWVTCSLYCNVTGIFF